MKLILSRKGFDSSAGGMPSPILPDGRLLPLPNPGRPPAGRGPLRTAGHDLRELLHGLSRGRIPRDQAYHVDPDLRPGHAGFGQHGAAARHLRHHGVGPGDLFLFFGWFREIEAHRGAWRWRPGAADRHVFFGWLSVGERLDLTHPASREAAQRRLPGHPHLVDAPAYGRLNDLYLPAPHCAVDRAIAGAGQFEYVHPARVLTRTGCSRSNWSLPAAFAPLPERPGLSYHEDPGRWQRRGNRVHLRAASRGQEFVLDLCGRPGVRRWLRRLLPA